MTDDLIFEELPPGRYNGTVEKVRYIFEEATHIVITYKVDTPVRRIVERLPINAPSSSALYFQTARGVGRVEEILRTKGLSLAEAQAAGGIRALPDLLEGSVICIVTRNRRTAGFNCPVVARVEALGETSGIDHTVTRGGHSGTPRAGSMDEPHEPEGQE